MRLIKFRAFWKDTGKPVVDFMTEYLVDACNDDSFIVNQFTGLKDVVGNELYEGDLIQVDYVEDLASGSYRGVIEWCDEGYWQVMFDEHGFSTAIFSDKIEGIRKIGTICENAELVKP